MAAKISKNKKQNKIEQSLSKKAGQIFLAIFAILLILSMVLSAVTTY